MYIIVGLGNPGKKYEHTRHNMGFLALDLLAEKYGIKLDKLKFKALTGEGRIDGKKVFLMKPQTYMNLSGESVRDALYFYKEPIENLIVIYDDIDLPEGHLRIRPSGSSGTHNGMRNIIFLLGEDGFPRIRVGIGNPVHPDINLADYVTGRITEREAEPIFEALKKAALAAEDIVINGVAHSMQEYNTKTAKKPKKSVEAAEETVKPAEKSAEAPEETVKPAYDTANHVYIPVPAENPIKPVEETIESKDTETAE